MQFHMADFFFPHPDHKQLCANVQGKIMNNASNKVIKVSNNIAGYALFAFRGNLVRPTDSSMNAFMEKLVMVCR